jgi:hypothetical protein
MLCSCAPLVPVLHIIRACEAKADHHHVALATARIFFRVDDRNKFLILGTRILTRFWIRRFDSELQREWDG